MAIRAQRIMIWWCLAFATIFALAWGILIGLMPLPPANQPVAEIAAFYSENAMRIRIGAAICAWTGAFMVPLSVVIAVQMARLEKGVPAWAILAFAGGIMMSMFLVIPPLLWGVAAFSPERPADVTALMHEFANLMLVTTDQYFIFQMIPLAIIALTRRDDLHSPFPRWYGYFTIWAALMFEVGAAGFIPKTGPFAWNGLFVFWFPLTIFGAWIAVTSYNLLRALKQQAAEPAAHG